MVTILSPRHPVAHFSILWLVRHAWNGNLFPTLIQAGEDYGPLVRIGPNLLLCSDADEVVAISGIRSQFTKGPAYDAGRVTDGDETHVASERDPAKHKALRLKMGPAYSISFQPAVDHQISNLMHLINRKYVSQPGSEPWSKPPYMDFGQKMHFYSLDFIGELAFGEPFGFLEKDEDVRCMTEINDLSIRIMTLAGLMPWLAGLRSTWPFRLLLPRDGDKVGFGTLFGFAKILVDKRMAPGAVPKSDMMQAFIRSGMTREQLMQQVYIHIVAGTDASADWARMTMLCLLTCPTAYLRLQREIDHADSTDRLSKPIAADREARKLVYLEAVLCESLRLHPPSIAPSKLSPSDGNKTPWWHFWSTGSSRSSRDNLNESEKEAKHKLSPKMEVCGYHIPANTQIGANVPGILRSKDAFGDDAGCFRPERWLPMREPGETQTPAAEAARLSRMRKTLDLVFGAGKFQCMGKAIVWMEVRKLFVELFRRFDFDTVDNIAPLHLQYFAFTVVHDFHM
ncbi:cytochrome P450 [Apiospora aurea]|uniref:Cytochrome P450 n=1 Tax=Apiospora aurea TaxID=335848 RepID=A0ABR1QN81_9PEZI